MGSSRRRAVVLATVVMGLVLGAAGCESGGGDGTGRPSGRASERTSTDKPESTRSVLAEPTRTEAPEPTRTRDPEPTTEPAETPTRRPTPTRTTATTEPAETTQPAETTATTRPPTTTAAAEPEPTPTTTAAEPTTPAASASATVTVAESEGLPPFGWLLVFLLLAALVVGGFLIYRAQQRSVWDAEARAVESETRAIAISRLPPVLTTTTTARRGLAWPPVRAGLADLVNRWNGLAERAVGESRRNWAVLLSGLLQDVIAAVDDESGELAAGRDWTLLRPRVLQVERALAEVLANQPPPGPPPAAEPGPPPYQT